VDERTSRHPAGDAVDAALADDVLRRIGERAADPEGWRRFDYRPDVRGLAAAVEAGLDLHPRASGPRLCPGCHQLQACKTRRGMEEALLRTWRQAADELLRGTPGVPATGRWFNAEGPAS
jgi:hypothetical protein